MLFFLRSDGSKIDESIVKMKDTNDYYDKYVRFKSINSCRWTISIECQVWTEWLSTMFHATDITGLYFHFDIPYFTFSTRWNKPRSMISRGNKGFYSMNSYFTATVPSYINLHLIIITLVTYPSYEYFRLVIKMCLWT